MKTLAPLLLVLSLLAPEAHAVLLKCRSKVYWSEDELQKHLDRDDAEPGKLHRTEDGHFYGILGANTMVCKRKRGDIAFEGVWIGPGAQIDRDSWYLIFCPFLTRKKIASEPIYGSGSGGGIVSARLVIGADFGVFGSGARGGGMCVLAGVGTGIGVKAAGGDTSLYPNH